MTPCGQALVWLSAAVAVGLTAACINASTTTHYVSIRSTSQPTGIGRMGTFKTARLHQLPAFSIPETVIEEEPKAALSLGTSIGASPLVAASLLLLTGIGGLWAGVQRSQRGHHRLLSANKALAGPQSIVICTATGEVSGEPKERTKAAATTSPDVTDYRARPFPLSMIVGCEEIKTALLLAAVNPKIGGVIISGGRGTAKSVMAKGLQRIMPPIERIKGNPFNIDPERPDQVDTFTEKMLEAEGKNLSDLEREVIPCPFVQIPLNIMEDRLLGSVDIEESVKQGKTVFSPGLLSKAHRGVLCIDDINLLDTELCNITLASLADGWVRVEREGVSVKYPCRPVLIATYNPQEQDVRGSVLDRFAVALSVDNMRLSQPQRVEAVQGVIDWGVMSAEGLRSTDQKDDALRTRILFSREFLKSESKISEAQLTYLCEEASRAGCQGQRAEIFAAEVAKAAAALEERPVSAEDLKLAVKLVITPRSSYVTNEDAG